jgi:quinohemoprotein ethanol dehydrogenase
MTEVSEKTIGKLGLAWSADIPSPDGPVGTPIVADGVVYLIGTRNVVFAHDLSSGRLRWVFDPQVKYSVRHVQPNWGARITRGLAYADGKVLINTSDCRLVAIDAKSGAKTWESQVCPLDDAYTITSAPRVGGGMVFVGPNNQDWGTRRGFVDAFDVESGRRLWRFNTIPGDPADAGKPHMAMAAKTWDPDFLPSAAGGSAWEDITYDPVTGLVYIGVGGASPWNPADRGKKRGDELFTNSIVALNARTGDYAWHFQTTPGDGWNLEPSMPPVLADMTIGGAKHRVLMEAPKNGFFYVLDAKTGKLLNKPQKFAKANWAKEIDFKTGRPVMDPEAEYWNRPEGSVVYPSPIGARNWHPMSYNPKTGLVYIPVMNLAAKMSIDRSITSFGGQVNMDMLYGLPESNFPLVAWDPIKQTKRWETSGALRGTSGVLSTAGNLVFQGAADGKLRAYRATDGVEVWSYDVGGPITAAPVTVRIGDGPQMIVVVSGTAGTSAVSRTYPQLYGVPGVDAPPRLLVFKLGGTAAAPRPVAAAPFQQPPLPRPDDALAERGRYLFEVKGCDACHGARAQAVPGSVPDLRRSSAETHATLPAIVIGGSRSDKGMPSFADSVTPDELKALQALMLRAAWEAYDAQERKK